MNETQSNENENDPEAQDVSENPCPTPDTSNRDNNLSEIVMNIAWVSFPDELMNSLTIFCFRETPRTTTRWFWHTKEWERQSTNVLLPWTQSATAHVLSRYSNGKRRSFKLGEYGGYPRPGWQARIQIDVDFNAHLLILNKRLTSNPNGQQKHLNQSPKSKHI